MPRKHCHVQHAPMVTDWTGQTLSKRARHLVQPGCIVRACISNCSTHNGEGLYLEVTKVKDGTVWGKVMGIYRMDTNSVGIATGSQYAVRVSQISEIPIMWQPRPWQRKFKRFLVPHKGRSITGFFW